MRERKPPARLNERAKSPVVLVRIRPDEVPPLIGGRTGTWTASSPTPRSALTSAVRSASMSARCITSW